VRVGRVDDRDLAPVPQEGVLGARRGSTIGTGDGAVVEVDADDLAAVVDVVGHGVLRTGDVDRLEPGVAAVAGRVDEAVHGVGRVEAVGTHFGAVVEVGTHGLAPIVETAVHPSPGRRARPGVA
jgi:hypothetical protein